MYQLLLSLVLLLPSVCRAADDNREQQQIHAMLNMVADVVQVVKGRMQNSYQLAYAAHHDSISICVMADKNIDKYPSDAARAIVLQTRYDAKKNLSMSLHDIWTQELGVEYMFDKPSIAALLLINRSMVRVYTADACISNVHWYFNQQPLMVAFKCTQEGVDIETVLHAKPTIHSVIDWQECSNLKAAEQPYVAAADFDIALHINPIHVHAYFYATSSEGGCYGGCSTL